jgi:predicted nuclease of predicted toxin-antitoxin system
MRLLLDADLSPDRIGTALRDRGHDVLSLGSDPGRRHLADPQVLGLAASEGRILVTRNSKDFLPLARAWAEAGRHHAGIILIWTLRNHEFGLIVDGVARSLPERPDPSAWIDLALAL